MPKPELLGSQGTRRFLAYTIAIAVFALMGGIALWVDAKPELVVAVFTPITTLALGYVVAGAWHDKNTRVAAIKADPGAQTPPAPVVING